MARRDWALPGAIAAAGFLALVLLLPSERDGEAAPSVEELTYVFPDGPRVVGNGTTVMVIAPVSHTRGLNASTGIDWRAPKVGFQPTTLGDIVCVRAPCDPLRGPALHHQANASEPRFRRDGYNATRATAYVFDESATLIATTAFDHDTRRFRDPHDVYAIQDGAWYFGAQSPAPNGTERLDARASAFIDRLMPQLDGQPVGAVATGQTNAYAALYGTLFVTVRLDELVMAP